MSSLVATDSNVSANLSKDPITGQKQKHTHIDDGLVELMEVLEEINENGPLAKINATTISDNNGGRIFL
jgi:hypothetical protein